MYGPDCPKMPWMVDFHYTNDIVYQKQQLDAAFADKHINYLSKLNVNSSKSPCRCTQIIGTLSSSGSVQCEWLEKLCSSSRIAGFRIPITEFSKEKYTELLSKISTINQHYSKKIGRLNPLLIMLDIKGPRICVVNKNYEDNVDHITKPIDCKLRIRKESEARDDEHKLVKYEVIDNGINPPTHVLYDNREVPFETIKMVESIVNTVVERAADELFGEDRLQPGIDIPDLCENDEEILQFAIESKVDALLISNVYDRDSIKRVKRELDSKGQYIFLMSKIDNLRGLDCIDDIINNSDGICIDPYKLMIKLPKEKIFLIQKSISAKCNKLGKPVYVVAKFENNEKMSKAEICEASNMIIDGIDGFMVDEDVTSKSMIVHIDELCKYAEPAIFHKEIFQNLTDTLTLLEPIVSIAISAVELSFKSNAAAIICTTSSGRTAKLLSRFRPRCPIIVITRHGRVARQVAMFKGCDPIIYVKPYNQYWLEDIDKRLYIGLTYGKTIGYINLHDIIVTVSPTRPDSGFTNSVRLFYASNFDNIVRKSVESKRPSGIFGRYLK